MTDRFVDLLHEGFDAVLHLGPFADSLLAIRYISQHRKVLCASPAYLARFGTPEKPGNLKVHDCLSYLNAPGLLYAQLLFSKDSQEEVIRVQSRFRVNDGRVLSKAAVSGCGIILQPEAVLRKHLDSEELMSLLDDYAAPTRDMALILSGTHPPIPKMRVLIDFIVAKFPVTLQA